MPYVLPIEGMRFPTEPGLKFGAGIGEGRPRGHIHQGVDIMVPTGTEVRSVTIARVIQVVKSPGGRPPHGRTAGGYGVNVLLQHQDERLWSHYAHMMDGSVPDNIHDGVWIGAGVKLGQVDGTFFFYDAQGRYHERINGRDHLHFEIRTRPHPRPEPHPDGGIIDRIDPEEWAVSHGLIISPVAAEAVARSMLRGYHVEP